MKQTTITLPSDIEAALEEYRCDQSSSASLPELAEAALRQFLRERGYIRPSRPLRLTPAERGSGLSDVSIEHDRYFAEG